MNRMRHGSSGDARAYATSPASSKLAPGVFDPGACHTLVRAAYEHRGHEGEEHAGSGRYQHVVRKGVSGEGDEGQPHDHPVGAAQPAGVVRDPKDEQDNQQTEADQAALHPHAQILVVGGRGLDQPREVAVRRNDGIAGTYPPAEPGRGRGRLLERRPQQVAAAEVAGLVAQHVEQPHRGEVGCQGHEQGQQAGGQQQGQDPPLAWKRRRADEDQGEPGHRDGIGKRRACSGQHQDHEIHHQQQERARLSLAIEFDQTGVDGREAEPGEEGGMAQPRQPFAASLKEQRTQAGNGEACSACDTEQRYPDRRANHRLRPASRQAAEREGKRRNRTGQRAEAFGLRQIMVQAMRLARDEHRQKAEARVEHVRLKAVAEDADRGEHQFRSLDRRDRGLEGARAEQIAERHLQRGSRDQQPGDAEHDCVPEGQDSDAARRRPRQRQPEPERREHGKGGTDGEQADRSHTDRLRRMSKRKLHAPHGSTKSYQNIKRETIAGGRSCADLENINLSIGSLLHN
jgi:hypothetical protein